MKKYFCIHCDKEVPVTIKRDGIVFYCECTGSYSNIAYLREVDDDKKEKSQIESNYVLDVNYYEARKIIKEYLSKNIFISEIVEATHLDIAMVNAVLHTIFEQDVN